jgi:hypothetical protein
MNLTVRAALSAAALAVGASAGLAQIGPRANQFPDVIVSSVGGSYDASGGVSSYGTSGGISSYAIGSDSCNLGSAIAIWQTNGSQYPGQHPVIGGSVYRLFNGRFEQIGMSWLKHGFCAADACSNNGQGSSGCANVKAPTTPSGNCVVDYGLPTGANTCDWLGYGRATDTYGSGLNGGQQYLGPRSEVNAWAGTFNYPWVRQGTNPVSCLNKRLLIAKTDLDPATYPRYNVTSNPNGAQFFGEVVYIVTDEWPNERYNNYSYRRINAGTTLSAGPSGCTETGYTLSFSSADRTVAQQPAIYAWKAADPAVKIAYADVPNDGRFYVGSKVTDLGGGQWQYEYAVFNMNSDRSANGFSIGKAASGVTVSSQAYRNQPYHSGEAYNTTPWTMASAGSSIDWTGPTYASPDVGNALRWSTLWNFRFVANIGPKTGSVRINLYKPAVVSGDAGFVDVQNVDVPGDPPPPACIGDFNQNGLAELSDIFGFLNAWFGGCLTEGPAPCTHSADANGNGQIDLNDIFTFLNHWFAGC